MPQFGIIVGARSEVGAALRKRITTVKIGFIPSHLVTSNNFPDLATDHTNCTSIVLSYLFITSVVLSYLFIPSVVLSYLFIASMLLYFLIIPSIVLSYLLITSVVLSYLFITSVVLSYLCIKSVRVSILIYEYRIQVSPVLWRPWQFGHFSKMLQARTYKAYVQLHQCSYANVTSTTITTALVERPPCFKSPIPNAT